MKWLAERNPIARSSQRGFALAEVCVVALLLAFAVSASSFVMSRSPGTHSKLRLVEVRTHLQELIVSASRNPSVIRNSSLLNPANVALRACLDDVLAAPDCSATDSSTVSVGSQFTRKKYPVALYDAVTNEPISGVESAPVLYTLEGVRCPTASATCAFEVVTWFRATCDAAAASCPLAEFIRIFYRIRVNPLYDRRGPGGDLAPAMNSPVANSPTLLAATFEVSESHAVNDILLATGEPAVIQCRGVCAGRYRRTLGRMAALSPLGNFSAAPPCPVPSAPPPIPMVSLCAMELE